MDVRVRSIPLGPNELRCDASNSEDSGIPADPNRSRAMMPERTSSPVIRPINASSKYGQTGSVCALATGV